MSRNLILIAIIGLLAACTTQGDGETTDTSMDAAPSVVASEMATASAGTEGTEGTTGTASAACADAFAAVAEQDVSSLSQMGDLPELEATIEQCESIADWTAGAEQAIGEEVNPSTAQLLLDIRCQLPALGNTAVCEEVASS